MPKNATIYLADPSLLSSRVFDRLPDVQSYAGRSDGDVAVGMTFACVWGTITMNIMAPSRLEHHLRGFEAYAAQVTDEANVTYTLSRISHIRMCLGCVIGHDDALTNGAYEFLRAFTAEVRGVLFVDDAIFDFTGERLGGRD